jgi:cardiolipin synthase
MLLAGRAVLRRGVELRINWWGRWAVWPLMAAIFLALCGVDVVDEVLLYIGLVLTIVATVQYGRSAVAQLRAGDGAPSSST